MVPDKTSLKMLRDKMPRLKWTEGGP